MPEEAEKEEVREKEEEGRFEGRVMSRHPFFPAFETMAAPLRALDAEESSREAEKWPAPPSPALTNIFIIHRAYGGLRFPVGRLNHLRHENFRAVTERPIARLSRISGAGRRRRNRSRSRRGIHGEGERGQRTTTYRLFTFV